MLEAEEELELAARGALEVGPQRFQSALEELALWKVAVSGSVSQESKEDPLNQEQVCPTPTSRG
jgi:hypothetical protein